MNANPAANKDSGADDHGRSLIRELGKEWVTVAACIAPVVAIVVLDLTDVLELTPADWIAVAGVVIAVVFGVVALRAAIRHQQSLFDVADNIGQVVQKAQEHRASLGAVAKDITTVTRSLDTVSSTILTRPIAHERKLSAITELVTEAGSWRAKSPPAKGPTWEGTAPPGFSAGERPPDLRVLCDNPAISIYSDGSAFDLYFQALKNQVAGCLADPPSRRVELMFLGPMERRTLHDHQVRRYTADADWRKWTQDSTRHEKLRAFWRRTARICGPKADPEYPADLKREDYIARLELVNACIYERDLHGASRHELKLPEVDGKSLAPKLGPAVYFWMRDEGIPDEQEAIFAIVPLGDIEANARELAFSTRDPALITALVGVFERYKQTGEAKAAG